MIKKRKRKRKERRISKRMIMKRETEDDKYKRNQSQGRRKGREIQVDDKKVETKEELEKRGQNDNEERNRG